MSTKKQRRTSEIRGKRQKKTKRVLLISFISLSIIGFLVFFFLTLFNYLYPPTADRHVEARKKEKIIVQLYFSDANERFLTTERRHVFKEKTATAQARELVKALLEGSKTGLVNTFPENTELQSLRIERDKTAYVSFGKNLLKLHPCGSASEMATLYSLTHTLTFNIPEIKRVKILVEDKEVESIGGHIDTRFPFEPNQDLVAPAQKSG
ncbi:MAG: GerMN domain-containing protein [Deltaproteobacteria bacterium]|nr:GerMN domain-containing protein [Deltaproteobacteria bacterium]